MKKEKKYLDDILKISKNIIELNENKKEIEKLEEIKKSMNFSYYDLYEKFKNPNSCYYTDIENLLLELAIKEIYLKNKKNQEEKMFLSDFFYNHKEIIFFTNYKEQELGEDFYNNFKNIEEDKKDFENIFKKIIFKNITFSNKLFLNNIDLDICEIKFENCILKNDINFENSIIKNLVFLNCELKNEKDFNLKIISKIYFDKSNFENSTLNFSNLILDEENESIKIWLNDISLLNSNIVFSKTNKTNSLKFKKESEIYIKLKNSKNSKIFFNKIELSSKFKLSGNSEEKSNLIKTEINFEEAIFIKSEKENKIEILDLLLENNSKLNFKRTEINSSIEFKNIKDTDKTCYFSFICAIFKEFNLKNQNQIELNQIELNEIIFTSAKIYSNFLMENSKINEIDFNVAEIGNSSNIINFKIKNTEIFENLYFKYTKFSTSSIYKEDYSILFYNCTFYKEIFFEDSKIIKSNTTISFEKSKIKRINFTKIKNIENLKELSFYGVNFENTPLLLNNYNCVINLLNSNIKNIEVKEIIQKIKPEKKDIPKIIKLKKLAEESGDIDTALYLNSIELNLKGGILNFMYKELSGYGSEILRPILYLIIWDLFFYIIYIQIINKTENVFGFILINNIPFIQILRNPNKDYFKYFYPEFIEKGILAIPSLDSFLIFSHFFVSFVLVFLIGLGIRNKFRLK